MKSSTLLISVFLLLITSAFAQSEKKAVRQGNNEFKKGEYLDSEISYRSALDINPSSFKANFNLGDVMYKQEKFEDATQIFEDLASLSIDSKQKAKVYHNLGNTYYKQQNFGESVEAYKNALRQNPNDKETKYNLAQAQRMLMEQEQQQDQSCDNNNDENKEDEQQDKQDKKDDQNQKDEQQEQEQKQEQQQQISPEDAKRMLEAIQSNEQEIQERVKEEQAKQQRIKVEKNW